MEYTPKLFPLPPDGTWPGEHGYPPYVFDDDIALAVDVALASEYRVVPVLVDEAPIPRADALPEVLSPLSRLQAVAIRSESFDEDLDRLINVLELLAKQGPQSPRSEPPPVGDATSEQPATHRDPEIEDLLDEIDNPKTPPERRLAIGDRLAELGDPRPGVGLTADGLPDIDWVQLPGGDFLYGEKNASAFLDSFRIARYPVTNAQYQAFIDAGGYGDKRWWVDLAQRSEGPRAPSWTQRNRPRTDVSWYESVAFCRWLSVELEMEIRLPTEVEWEKAARATDGREYPWGNDYRTGLANINEQQFGSASTDLQQTTAVGLYPQGNSPYGVSDLVGNVWEWCANKYQDPKGTDIGDNADRVLRGGSWLHYRDDARSAVRGRGNPVSRSGNLGFRVLCSSPIFEH